MSEELTPAVEALKLRLEHEPKSRVFAQLAEAYRKDGRLDEAAEVCREGLEIHPSYYTARVTLARILHEKDDNDGAVAELETVLSASAANLTANRLLADIYYDEGRYGEALGRYEHILGLNPMDEGVEKRVKECREKLPEAVEIPESESRENDDVTQTTKVEIPKDLIAAQRNIHSDTTRTLSASHSDTSPSGEALMTSETLAVLYEEQGLWSKALHMYETLHLREPENPVYIEKIKMLREPKGGVTKISEAASALSLTGASDVKERLKKNIAALQNPSRDEKIHRLRSWLRAVEQER